MIKFIKTLILNWLNRNWLVVESKTGIWNVTHGTSGLVQDFVFYNIEFNPIKNRYRLTTQGNNATQHRMYGEMLKRLASYNTDVDIDEFVDDAEIIEDRVVLVTIPLFNEADKVWTWCKDDPILIQEKDKLKEKLIQEGIEIYEERYNILATSKGYIGTFWYSDVKDLPIEDSPLDERDEEDFDEKEDEDEDID